MGLPEVDRREAYGALPDGWCRYSSGGSQRLGIAIHHGITVVICHGAHEVMITIRHGVTICYGARKVMASRFIMVSRCHSLVICHRDGDVLVSRSVIRLATSLRLDSS